MESFTYAQIHLFNGEKWIVIFNHQLTMELLLPSRSDPLLNTASCCVQVQ
jgi:hypothetical protein